MPYQSMTIAIVALMFAATQVDAQIMDVVVENFDASPLETTKVTAGDPDFFVNYITGGTVVAGTLDNPAHSGNHVYGGKTISFVTSDEDQFSWPAVGAWISGTAIVRLQAYEYDSVTHTEKALPPVSRSATNVNAYLSVGSMVNPRFITRATFSSASYFTIDDLTFGLEGFTPGIPEPASWTTMIGGLGLVGTAMRRRRATVARTT